MDCFLLQNIIFHFLAIDLPKKFYFLEKLMRL